MKNRTLIIDVPTLRLDWIAREMPRLHSISREWHRGPIRPVFPALTCPSQATLTTGVQPSAHGIIANGIFDRATKTPEFWVFTDEAVQARRIWEDFRGAGRKAGVFFFLNIRDAKADAAILPKPVHKPDGSMEMWCWHKPDGLYSELVKSLGHFNLLRFWGPMAGIQSSQWIAEAAKRTIRREDLDLAFIYLPHTDYAPQKFGPESEAYRSAHRELDGVIADLIESLEADSEKLNLVLVSEYAITGVTRFSEPNKTLRKLGLLAIRNENGRESLDYFNSPAFAMVDHQIAHVYCGDRELPKLREAFEGDPAIEQVADPAEVGLDHPRSGELVLIARRDAWFAYPWWDDFAAAPEWAAKIDIHNKPGYDPLEMFWDPKINGTSQDARLIKGSHGAAPSDADQQAAIVSNLPGIENAVSTADIYRSIKSMLTYSRR